jgi:hypothetical protein
MENPVADVVSTTATKIKLDKNFLIGAAAGATIVAGAVLVKKVVAKVKERTAEDAENESA